MSAAPTVAPRRQREKMSEPGDPSPSGAAVRVEDIERALVLAREVAAATASGGAANLRIDHLRALFGNGTGPADPERMQAALEAAGLAVDPPLSEEPSSVSLRVERRRAALAPKATGASRGPKRGQPAAAADDEPPPRPTGVAAYQAATGAGARRAARARARESSPSPAAGVSLDDAQRLAAADHAGHNTPQAIAGLMPVMIVPVLAASFLGPLFGAAFAGLALLASALLSRPGALADGKLGPIRMPASLARSFLLLTCGVALGALATSAALVFAGGDDTKPSDPNAPIEQKQPATPTPAQPKTTTTPPAPPAAQEQKQQDTAAAKRRAARRRAALERRRRARARESTPPSGGADTAPAAP